MKRTFLLVAALCGCSQATAPVSLVGTWTTNYTVTGSSGNIRADTITVTDQYLIVTQQGDSLGGYITGGPEGESCQASTGGNDCQVGDGFTGDAPLQGVVNGSSVNFSINSVGWPLFVFTGTISGNTMRGTATRGSLTGTFTATKQ